MRVVRVSPHRCYRSRSEALFQRGDACRVSPRASRRPFGAQEGQANESEAHDRASRRRRRRGSRRLRRQRQAAVAQAPTITIWADQDRKAAVTQLANAVGHGPRRDRRTSSSTTSARSATTSAPLPPADAPDVIMGAHDWTGQLAANGLVAADRPQRGDEGAVPGVHARTRSRTAPP